MTVQPGDVFAATPDSSGKLLPGIVVRVVKPDGTLAAPGEEGELVVKGPSNALGYFNDEKAYAVVFYAGCRAAADRACSTGRRRHLSTGTCFHLSPRRVRMAELLVCLYAAGCALVMSDISA